MNEEQNRHKSEIDSAKHQEILLCLSRIVFLVFREGNQACQRSNECAEASDVDCRKEAMIICRKVRQ